MLQEYPYDVVNGVPMTVFTGFDAAKLYLVNTPSEWNAFYELLMNEKLVACDTETDGLRYFKGDKVIGLSFGWRDTHFYIPLRHSESVLGGTPPPQIDMDDIRGDLQAFFAQRDVITIWHNWKFDAHFYRADDIEILTPHHDTMLQRHFKNENAPGALKIIASGWRDEMGRFHKGLVDKSANAKEKELAKWRSDEAKARRDIFRKLVMDTADEMQTEIKYQAYSRVQLKKHISDNILKDHPYKGAKKDDIHYGYVPVTLMCEYAGMDTYLTWKVYKDTVGVVSHPSLHDLYINEIKLSRTLMEAEEAAVLIDAPHLRQSKVDLMQQEQDLEKEIYKKLGKKINLGSTKQLADALLAAGVPLTRKTDAGNYQIDKKVLDKLKSHQVVKDILDLRTVNKIRNTYVDSILDKLVDDKYLHCNFRQNVRTGRMASSDPNLQNIPGRDTVIRKAFICPPEHVYIFADYSQIEVRLTAHYSQDPLLLDAYKRDQDVHTRTMCEMFGHSYNKAVEILDDSKHPEFKEIKDLRNVAKRINFGIIYGVGAPGLSEQISRPQKYAHLSDKDWVMVCQSFIDAYLYKYLGVKRFIKKTERLVEKNCEITNHFGRTRHLPEVRARKIMGDDSQRWREAKAKRQGVNFLIQGTAADLFKIAAVRVHDYMRDKESKVVNFVHDEIQIYLHETEFHCLGEVKRLMEDFEFSVPIIADIEWSKTSWADKQAIK